MSKRRRQNPGDGMSDMTKGAALGFLAGAGAMWLLKRGEARPAGMPMAAGEPAYGALDPAEYPVAGQPVVRGMATRADANIHRWVPAMAAYGVLFSGMDIAPCSELMSLSGDARKRAAVDWLMRANIVTSDRILKMEYGSFRYFVKVMNAPDGSIFGGWAEGDDIFARNMLQQFESAGTPPRQAASLLANATAAGVIVRCALRSSGRAEANWAVRALDTTDEVQLRTAREAVEMAIGALGIDGIFRSTPLQIASAVYGPSRTLTVPTPRLPPGKLGVMRR